MISKIYSKVSFPLAIVFFGFGLIIIFDFFLPKNISKEPIQKLYWDVANFSKYGKSKTYSIGFKGETIATNSETYKKLILAESLKVSKTKILGKVVKIQSFRFPREKFEIFVAPFTYFPLFAIIFLLPLPFSFIKKETIFFILMPPLTIVIAIFSTIFVIY